MQHLGLPPAHTMELISTDADPSCRSVLIREAVEVVTGIAGNSIGGWMQHLAVECVAPLQDKIAEALSRLNESVDINQAMQLDFCEWKNPFSQKVHHILTIVDRASGYCSAMGCESEGAKELSFKVMPLFSFKYIAPWINSRCGQNVNNIVP